MTLSLSAPNTTAGATMTPTGAKLYAPEPLAPEFGVRLCNNDMAPAYRLGDTALVRKLYEGEEVTADADYLFAQHSVGGGVVALLARLTRITKTMWVCEMHNAKGRRLPRGQWSTVYVVTGKYCTSNPALQGGPERERT